jgi:hypothetical protein
MRALAREEATRGGFHNIESREMDAEEPNLPAQTFHAILCRWGLMFLPQLGSPSTDCGACYAQEGCLRPPPGARRRWAGTDAERNHMCFGTEREPIKQGQ